MSATTAKMRVILLVWLGLFLLCAKGNDISREQNLKLRRHLKHVNKATVKTIKTNFGDIFDCVDIYKQLAFDHPLLKNHTLQMIPTSLPKETKDPLHSDGRISLAKIRALLNGGCPEGTVPIRRTRMKDLLRAPSLYLHGKIYTGNGTYGGNSKHPLNDIPRGRHWVSIVANKRSYYGTKVAMSLWNVTLADNGMFSRALFRVAGGPEEHLNTIEAGWTVNHVLYGDQLTRLFAFWTGDKYNNGCYNTLCPGDVHQNRDVPLGIAFPQVSTYLGTQSSVTLRTFQDLKSGVWWLTWGEDDQVLGFFPREIFPTLGHGPATSIEWRGETYTPPGNLAFPPMGSGHFAEEGYGKAASMRWIRVYDTERNEVDAPIDTDIRVESALIGCYDLDDPKENYGGRVGRTFFYGGPGGTC